MKHKMLISVVLLLAAVTLSAQKQVRFEQLDSLPNNRNLVYHGAVNPHWTDATHFWYETREAVGMKYYMVDAEAQTKTEVEKASLPEESNDRRYGRYPRNGWGGNREAMIPSPDSLYEAYIFDHNVYVKAKGEKTGTQLSFNGTEHDGYSRIMWSPDSKKIAAVQTREVEERRIPLVESSPATQKQPILQWRDYAKPGDVLDCSRPALFNVEKKCQIPVDAKPFENQFSLYITGWMNDASAFTFEFNERGHQCYQVVAVDAESGETKVIIDERANTFIYYNRIYRRPLSDGTMLWASERDGWRHLYRIDMKTGEVKGQLTKGEWVFRDVVTVDEASGYMIFTANGQNKDEDPYQIHYYRMNLDGTGMTDLTPENGNHSASFSSDYKYFVDSYSRPDCPPTSLLKEAEGNAILALESADITALKKTGWTMPEVFSAKGRDGVTDIWGTIYRPSRFNKRKQYPVVEYIYAGPHDSHVEKNFSAYSRFSKLLEMGFIVVTIDGMGTANRSKAFHDVCWRNLKDAGFPDRILWMQAAAKKYPQMNLSKVGIYGYSAGGQNALTALLFHGDFYKVGVALCGCHDNRMDKIWWNEQWMGYPLGPWYAESSNVDNAYRLTGDLFLINGELDDNVDPTSTLQVVDALIKAKKDFRQLYLPGHTHNLGSDYITRQVFNFFVEHCK